VYCGEWMQEEWTVWKNNKHRLALLCVERGGSQRQEVTRRNMQLVAPCVCCAGEHHYLRYVEKY
jgi:hypothetical protein